MRYQAILAIALLLLSGCAQEAIRERTEICTILPMSGDLAFVGQEMSRGAELAIAEANAQGGWYDLIIEDDRYSKRDTVTAARKLLSENDCAALAMPFIETTTPIIPIAQAEEIPVVVMLDRTQEVDANDYIFSTGFSMSRTGIRFADYARSRGASRAAVIMDNVEFSQIIGGAFAERFASEGGVVAERTTLPENDDFRSIIARLQDSRPDVIFAPLSLNRQDVLIKRIREQGIGALILVGDAYTEDLIAATGSAAEGVCKVDVPLPETKEVEALLERYAQAYGEESLAPAFVLLGYESTRVLTMAMDGAQSHDGPAIKESLLARDYPSIFGGTLSLDDDESEWRAEEIYCIEDGELVPE